MKLYRESDPKPVVKRLAEQLGVPNSSMTRVNSPRSISVRTGLSIRLSRGPSAPVAATLQCGHEWTSTANTPGCANVAQKTSIQEIDVWGKKCIPLGILQHVRLLLPSVAGELFRPIYL